MTTEDKDCHVKIMSDAIGVLNDYQKYRNPPELAREMLRIVRLHTGIEDPYFEVKKKDMQTAARLNPMLKQHINSKQDKLLWALKAAAIGNVLDSAICINSDIEQSIDAELNKTLVSSDTDFFKQQLKTAKSVLIIGDNAGETVFDCLLLEQIQGLDLTYAVRSAPIINDATVAEAKASGVGRYAHIMSTGCDMPGVTLEECSSEFIDCFHKADIVISKGQGNFETLSNCDRNVYFLLKAKCPVVSTLLGVSLNDYVFKYSGDRKA